MYQERYSRMAALAERRRRAQRRKALVIALALVGVLSVGGTLAWIVDGTGSVVNRFTPAQVEGEVEEKFDDKVKSDVAVENTSDIPVYVRATLVVNWVDKDGAIAATKPVKDLDYEVVFNEDGSWDLNASDGYYYYTQPVPAEGSSSVLVESIKPKIAKDGYTLKVDVVGSVIQAIPTAAVVESWGVTLGSDGKSISK